MARFEKGKSGNLKGAPVKQAGRILAFGSADTNMPVMPYEDHREQLLNQNIWTPFGTDNLFPQAIAELSRKSPSLRSVLNWKTNYVAGDGFITDTKDKKLIKFLEEVNPEESAADMIEKSIFDRFSSGNTYIEIVLTSGGMNIFHKDHTTCRVSKDKKHILLYGDWQRVQGHEKDIKKLPIYPAFENIDGKMRSCAHLKSYEPGFSTYGVPSWMSAIDAAGIAYKTNKWNISRLDNSFNNSGVLVVEGNMSPKEAQKMKKAFLTEFTGENKQGKVLFLAKQLGGGNTTFTTVTTNNEGDWLQLHTQSDTDLLKAHMWFASLSGIGTQNAFEQSRIRAEYPVAMSKVISKEQKFFLRFLKKIIKLHLKLDASDLNFHNIPPTSMFDIDVNKVMTKGEARKMLGLEVDDSDKTMDEYIDDGSTPQFNIKPEKK